MGLSLEQSLLKLLAGPAEMLGHILQDRGEGPEAKRIVAWDRDVVLAGLVRGEPHVAAGLADRLVSVATKKGGELCARECAFRSRMITRIGIA